MSNFLSLHYNNRDSEDPDSAPTVVLVNLNHAKDEANAKTLPEASI